MERFPQPGESFIYDGMQITVLDADERRVEKVLVRRLPEEKEDK